MSNGFEMISGGRDDFKEDSKKSLADDGKTGQDQADKDRQHLILLQICPKCGEPVFPEWGHTCGDLEKFIGYYANHPGGEGPYGLTRLDLRTLFRETRRAWEESGRGATEDDLSINYEINLNELFAPYNAWIEKGKPEDFSTPEG